MTVYEHVLQVVEEKIAADDSFEYNDKNRLLDLLEKLRDDQDLFLDAIQVVCIGMANSSLFLTLILSLVGIPVIDGTGDKKETVH